MTFNSNHVHSVVCKQLLKVWIFTKYLDHTISCLVLITVCLHCGVVQCWIHHPDGLSSTHRWGAILHQDDDPCQHWGIDKNMLAFFVGKITFFYQTNCKLSFGKHRLYGMDIQETGTSPTKISKMGPVQTNPKLTVRKWGKYLWIVKISIWAAIFICFEEKYITYRWKIRQCKLIKRSQ